MNDYDIYIYVYYIIMIHFYLVSTSDPSDVPSAPSGPSTRSYPEVDPDASSFKAAANCCERGAMASHGHLQKSLGNYHWIIGYE